MRKRKVAAFVVAFVVAFAATLFKEESVIETVSSMLPRLMYQTGKKEALNG